MNKLVNAWIVVCAMAVSSGGLWAGPGEIALVPDEVTAVSDPISQALAQQALPQKGVTLNDPYQALDPPVLACSLEQ